MMADHPLDRPVWHALTGPHARFALGGGLARRFHPAIGPLSAAAQDDDVGMRALAALVPADEALFTLQALRHGELPGIATERREALQMIADMSRMQPETDGEMTRLTSADAEDMLALATLTEPGPFGIRTGELGQFWGVKAKGKLVAMAGERLRLDGYTEVSGVCVHPAFRGRGHARALMLRVMRQIADRGETPFLTAYAHNKGAIALYESIGFRTRREMVISVLRRA